LAAWPGTLPAGNVYEPPVINLDVAATAVALAGEPYDDRLDGVDLMPYLLGKKAGNPHDALFWRWRSQAAVRADHWKLILLGPEERYLFDLDSPESETKNRIADFPHLAADLEKKLLAWNAALPPPGLPRELNAQDQLFFDVHVNKSGAVVTKRPRGSEGRAARGTADSGSAQGWLGRNCRLTLRDGALSVGPDAAPQAARPFITYNGLDLAGPVTATVRLRCPAGGSGSFAWRTQGQKDFGAGQAVSFNLAASPDWQEVKVTLPANGHVIHVRLHLPAKGTSAIASIALQAADKKNSTAWQFSKESQP
jgi:hypothetical protein